MKLLIIRHADAGSHDAALWPDDTLRPLSDKGRKRQRRVAKRLRRRDLTPTLLLASPWLRAWQTAVITAEVTGSAAPLACPALAEPPDAARLAKAVGSQPPEALVALVGHEPWLGEFVSILLAGEPHRVVIDFPKSGVVGLEADAIGPGSATLSFFWRPKGD